MALESNPGSLKQFVEAHGLQVDQDAVYKHSLATLAYREELVAVLGYDSLESLHTSSLGEVESRMATLESVGHVALQ